MNYDKLEIPFNGKIYKMGFKGWIGNSLVRAFGVKIKGVTKQLGTTMFTEQELDDILQTGKLP